MKIVHRNVPESKVTSSNCPHSKEAGLSKFCSKANALKLLTQVIN